MRPKSPQKSSMIFHSFSCVSEAFKANYFLCEFSVKHVSKEGLIKKSVHSDLWTFKISGRGELFLTTKIR
jgi:hypothetical protein